MDIKEGFPRRLAVQDRLTLGAINNNVVGSGRTPRRAGAVVFVTSVK